MSHRVENKISQRFNYGEAYVYVRNIYNVRLLLLALLGKQDSLFICIHSSRWLWFLQLTIGLNGNCLPDVVWQGKYRMLNK